MNISYSSPLLAHASRFVHAKDWVTHVTYFGNKIEARQRLNAKVTYPFTVSYALNNLVVHIIDGYTMKYVQVSWTRQMINTH